MQREIENHVARAVSYTHLDVYKRQVWKRCAVSLLPLLTTKVKICPVSKTRIIDINKDSLNDYGWFSRTLLEVFNNNSIYCDTNMISA